MPRVHHVKHARKDYPDHGIKKGEPYYWWKFRTGGIGGSKRFSKTPPTPSQLTQSEFLSTLYSIQEEWDAADMEHKDDVISAIENAKGALEELRDDTQNKLDNMPDGLQQGDTGQMMQDRIAALETLIDTLDSVDLEDEDQDLSDTVEALNADLDWDVS
jgi:hypothetical protein